ncbi:hypothetical protein [Bacillus sp. 1P06AnD]|uniref:hypothetical protein n=1 Tax=Bacillus sp. 1P06AnD TaxID=3132208 RepID=UPI00399FF2A4
MFDPNDETIYIFWSEIQHFEDNNFSEVPVLIDGFTLVDAYSIPNKEVKQYIIERNYLFNEAESYFKGKRLRIGRFLQGSEDGEAVCTLDKKGKWDNILFLLDPETLHTRKQVKDFEEFLDRIK